MSRADKDTWSDQSGDSEIAEKYARQQSSEGVVRRFTFDDCRLAYENGRRDAASEGVVVNAWYCPDCGYIGTHQDNCCSRCSGKWVECMARLIGPIKGEE